MMVPRLLGLALILAAVTPAHAELGAMIGARMTWLAGDVRDDSRSNLAAAAIVMRTVGPGLAIGIEPGVTVSGSREYRFVDVMVPIVGRYTHRLDTTQALRASAGIGPALRVLSDYRTDGERGVDWNHLEDVRSWDVNVLAGIGYERSHFFIELRVESGVLSLDARENPLAIVRREVGLWLGYAR
jgi:hypothetical protein